MRLVPPSVPQAFEIGPVRFSALPATQFVRDLAQNRGRKRAREMVQQQQLWAEYGLENTSMADIFIPDADLPDGEALDGEGMDDVLTGYGLFIYAVELALLTLKGWEGLQSEAGEADPPITRRNISLLFLYPVEPGSERTFALAYIAKVHGLGAPLAREGNACASGLSGSSGPEAISAGPAGS